MVVEVLCIYETSCSILQKSVGFSPKKCHLIVAVVGMSVTWTAV